MNHSPHLNNIAFDKSYSKKKSLEKIQLIYIAVIVHNQGFIHLILRIPDLRNLHCRSSYDRLTPVVLMKYFTIILLFEQHMIIIDIDSLMIYNFQHDIMLTNI